MAQGSPPQIGGVPPDRRYNVLVVYYYASEHPVRTTSADHLYCFRRYAGHNCYYLNLAFRDVPDYVLKTPFDLIIFHTLFLSERWDRVAFGRLAEKVAALKRHDAVKVALPQDEFLNTDILSDFINDFGIAHAFSVAPESECGKIYATVDRRRVKLTNVLTGYLDDSTVRKIGDLAASDRPRTIDVGYRAWRAAAWLGRHGKLKVLIADLFAERAPARGLVTDISTRAGDTFLGDAWYEFLLRCKYMIGVEGGASLLDRDGSVRERTDAYERAHPEASFEEVEANCFPGLDGGLRLFALSPRHLEACATRTCQVLVEGEYNGVLRPGEHYIELRRDFSNVEQVLDLMADGRLRAEITERAYRDVVGSGRYTYRSFVETVIGESLSGRAPARAAARGLAFRWARAADKLTWAGVMLHWRVTLPFRGKVVAPAKRRAREKLVGAFSEQFVSSLLRRLRRG